jgi:hypothetical protein
MLKPIRLEGRRGYAWGYQDEKSSPVIGPFFAEAREFSEGIAAVKFTCSWGYINIKGEIVIPPTFDDASSFCEGLARVRVGSKYGFVNQAGEFTIFPQFVWASDFVDGLAKIKIRAYKVGDIYRSYDAFLDRDGQIFNRFFDVVSQNADNSVILYQQTNYQIAFSVDQKSAVEIANWITGITLSHNQVRDLEVVDDHPRHYCLNLKFVKDQVYLSITRNTLEQATHTQFSKPFNKQLSNELKYSEAIGNFPKDVNGLQQLVLKIEGEFYQYLVNWEHWVSVEAFTGRYIYEFFNEPNDNRFISSGIYVRVIDSVTHKVLHLDYSWRLENYEGWASE